ncbi:hypothetical protein KO481_24855 [Nocardia sp. NEAU-G5]|uniref:EF-hand domain-containing protein n=2 Tax=Nocardia albiluteola TaxID=2842303 RepID=A0ABS6B365_9NOCA|nr:hypothetical protein [Nocardia albiluteola]
MWMAVRGSARGRGAGAVCALVALAMGAAACGGDPDAASVAAARSSAYAALTSSSQAAAASSANRPPIPTAAQLDTQLKRALDPALPDSDRINLIQDGQAFASSIPDMYKALHDNPHAVYGVVDPVFDNHDGTLTATLRLDKDGTGEDVRTTIMHFIDIDGTWKISRNDLCGVLRSADYKTPACG